MALIRCQGANRLTPQTLPLHSSEEHTDYGGSSSSSSGGGGGGGSSSSSALAFKLAAALAWPCMSAASVGGALAAKASAAPSFGIAVGRATAAAASVALLLTLGLAAARFAREVGRGEAGDAAVVDFGARAGLLCGAQAAVNGLQLALGLLGGGLSVRDVAGAVVSSAVLLRLAYTAWLLQGEARPSAWLRMMSLEALLARAS
jgi:hypothetical protein